MKNHKYSEDLYTREESNIKQKQVFRDVLKANGITVNFLAKEAGIDPQRLFRCLDAKIETTLSDDERAFVKAALEKISKNILNVSTIIEFNPDSKFQKLKELYGDVIFSMPIYKHRVVFFEYMISNGYLPKIGVDSKENSETFKLES